MHSDGAVSQAYLPLAWNKSARDIDTISTMRSRDHHYWVARDNKPRPLGRNNGDRDTRGCFRPMQVDRSKEQMQETRRVHTTTRKILGKLGEEERPKNRREREKQKTARGIRARHFSKHPLPALRAA